MAHSALPSNLYAGGAVKIDTNPLTHFIVQTQLRQQAKDDALMRYFGDLSKNLTPSGMHSNDIPGFMDKKNQWQQYVMSHKKEYDHPSLDNGKTYTQAQSMYNDALEHAQLSKSKVQNLASLKPVMDDPKKRALLTESTLADIQNAERPVHDPNYRPIDMSHINYNPTPFGVQDESRITNILNRKNLQPTETVDQITDDKKTGTRRIRYKNSFNNDQLDAIHTMADDLYYNHPGWKDMIDKHANPDNENYKGLNDTYKRYYGKDITTPEDMSAAEILVRHPLKDGREAVTTIPVTMADKKELIAAHGAQTQANATYSHGLKVGEKAATAGVEASKARQHFDTIYEAAKKTPPLSLPSDPKRYWYSLPVSDDAKAQLSRKDPNTGHDVAPNDVYVSNNGKTIKPIFYTDANKKVVNKNLSKDITKEEFEQVVGKHQFGVKEINKDQPKPTKDPLGLF